VWGQALAAGRTGKGKGRGRLAGGERCDRVPAVGRAGLQAIFTEGNLDSTAKEVTGGWEQDRAPEIYIFKDHSGAAGEDQRDKSGSRWVLISPFLLSG
jgi:hypothetical protein